MDENLSSILSSIMNNPVSNWARRMGSKMAGGGDPVANYEPSPSMNMDWSKVRATQRPGYKREPSPYDESAITKLAEGRTVGFEDFAFPKNEKMPDAVQRQEGMGLNNIAGRHGSFPLTEPPFGASGTLDTALPGMGYDYTNEGYTDFTPMGYDYTNEGYAGPWAPSYADEYAGERSPLNAVSQADWSTPQRAVSSGPTFAERDMLANAGENRDLLGIGQPVGSPPVDPREIAIKKRFGQNIGNLWGDARLRERMQDLYGGSL
jgi:hypothetical protein